MNNNERKLASLADIARAKRIKPAGGSKQKHLLKVSALNLPVSTEFTQASGFTSTKPHQRLTHTKLNLCQDLGKNGPKAHAKRKQSVKSSPWET